MTADLSDRLERAAMQLSEAAMEASTDMEAMRLLGKAEGVRLALSYLREY